MNAHTIQVTWGDVILDGGFAQVPTVFLEHADLLGVGPKDQLILIHLMGFIHHGRPPVAWPSLRTLSARTGIPYRTLKRRIQYMRLSGLLEVTNRQRTNESNVYNLQPLARLIRRLVKPGAKTSRGPGGLDGPRVGATVAPEEEVLKNTNISLPERERIDRILKILDLEPADRPRARKALRGLMDRFEWSRIESVARREHARIAAAKSPIHYLVKLLEDPTRRGKPTEPVASESDLERARQLAAKMDAEDHYD